MNESVIYYLYAIIHEGSASCEIKGVLGLPVFYYNYQGVALCYSTLDPEQWSELQSFKTNQATTNASIQEVSDHNPIAQHQLLHLYLHKNCQAILPLKYGMAFLGEKSIIQFCEENYASFLSQLEVSLGSSEYHIRVSVIGEKEQGREALVGTGRAFFLDKYRQYQEEKTVRFFLGIIQEGLQGAIPSTHITDSTKQSNAIIACIPSMQEHLLYTVCEEVLKKHLNINIQVEGPWPVYNGLPKKAVAFS